jgi:hypothetical protein
MKSTSCRFCWSVLLLLASPVLARAASTLNFPRLSFENDRYTGIAIVNPSSSDAVVTLTAYGPGGERLAGSGFTNPAQITIRARQQVAKLTTEMFGTGLSAATVGWFQATSPADGLTGFFLFLDGAVTFLDGADLPPSSLRLTFQQVRIADGATTELDVVNPSATAANVQVQLVSAGSPSITKTFTLPAKGTNRMDAAAFFGTAAVSAGAYVLVQSDVELAGIEFVKDPRGDLLGLNARLTSERLNRLVFPQLAVLGDYKTELGVINYATSSVILTITAFQPNGKVYAAPSLRTNPVTRTLAAGASLREDVETLFGFTGSGTLTGWLEVTSSSQSINGYLSYGIGSTGALAAVASAAQGRTRALFSHIATSGYFTGVAVLNPSTLAANFRLVAMKPTGEVLGSYDGVLQPGERIAKLVGTPELIPEAANQNGGLVWVKSDVPVFLASIFGSTQVLANVPPQDAPDSYAPDTGLPVLRVRPALAVVRPSGMQAFSVEGTTGSYQWKVDGTPGGQPSTGRINTAGIFTAPATVPPQQVVTVASETDRQAAAASVDVIEKSTVIGEVNVVQSVVYLESLRKLYSIEFEAASGGFLRAGGVLAPERGDSKVDEVSLGGARNVIVRYSGENIAKILTYRGIDRRDYLLMSGQIGGRIIRLDPVTRQSRDVVTGLKEPSAMVFDPATGDLVVAERDKITTVARSVLDTGLSSASPAPANDPTLLAPISIAGVRGLVVNRCNGKLYMTLATDGLLVEYDPATGKSRNVMSGLRDPGALLAIYRKGGSCPDAFHLLMSENGNYRTLLVTSLDGAFTRWLEIPVTDLSFLPSGNPFTTKAGIVIGESTPASSPYDSASGYVTIVPLGLYDSEPPNPVVPVP